MGGVVEHDPELAWAVFVAYAEVAGRKRTKGAYHAWLRRYVYPLARALEREGVLAFVNPYDPRERRAQVTASVPAGLKERLLQRARREGVPMSAVVRRALEAYLDGACNG